MTGVYFNEERTLLRVCVIRRERSGENADPYTPTTCRHCDRREPETISSALCQRHNTSDDDSTARVLLLRARCSPSLRLPLPLPLPSPSCPYAEETDGDPLYRRQQQLLRKLSRCDLNADLSRQHKVSTGHPVLVSI